MGRGIEMMKILLGFVLVLIFPVCGYCYDWSGTYETIDYDEDPRGGDCTVQIRKSGIDYRVDVEFREKHVRYPSTCYLKNVVGKTRFDNMLSITNSKNSDIITLLKTSKYIRMNFDKNSRGLFGYCISDFDGKKFTPDREFENGFREDIFEGMMLKKISK